MVPSVLYSCGTFASDPTAQHMKEQVDNQKPSSGTAAGRAGRECGKKKTLIRELLEALTAAGRGWMGILNASYLMTDEIRAGAGQSCPWHAMREWEVWKWNLNHNHCTAPTGCLPRLRPGSSNLNPPHQSH